MRRHRLTQRPALGIATDTTVRAERRAIFIGRVSRATMKSVFRYSIKKLPSQKSDPTRENAKQCALQLNLRPILLLERCLLQYGKTGRREKKTLLLGFEPFRKRSINPSWEVCRRVALRFPSSKVLIPPRALPVDPKQGPAMALELVRKCDPDVVPALGLAAGTPAIRLERFAFNAFLPDGHSVSDVPRVLSSGGPDAVRTRAPVEAAARRLLRSRIPVTISNTPGLFVCNALYYTLRLEARRRRKMRVLFAHLPLLPRQSASSIQPVLPSMSLAMQTRAVALVIKEFERRF